MRVREDELESLLVAQLQLVSEAEFDTARKLASRLRISLVDALVARGAVPLVFLLRQLAAVWHVGFVDLKLSDVRPDALALVSEKYAREHALVPFARQDGRVSVAMADPRDQRVVDELERQTMLEVVAYLAPEPAIRRAQLLYKGDLHALLERSAADEIQAITTDRGDGAPSASRLLTRILEYAAASGASDVHIEPFESEVIVRYRIDGALHEVLSLPPAVLPSLISRIKILSEMRIDERRIPQDGRFVADLGGFTFDLRVSAIPTLYGEKVALRVLTKEVAVLGLEDLGLLQSDFEILQRNIARPFGMILVTGPTGAGKTTTLYAILMRLGAEHRRLLNVCSVEDPVEYSIPRVNQIAVSPAVGLTFASALRSLLRQDPDILMVGEIRDTETAEVAVRAALAGRLLLASLHTNDATTTIPRLLEMGIEPYLVASTLCLVVSQRLARRICVDCRESFVPDSTLLRILQARPDYAQTIAALQAEGTLRAGADPLDGIRLFRGRGCPRCQGSGYRGRVGIFEIFEPTAPIRTLTLGHADAATIRAAAIEAGMRTMFQDGLAKVVLAETTLEELLRVVV